MTTTTEFPEDDIAGWLARKQLDPTPQLRLSEAGKVLKFACAGDNRSVTDEATVAWHDVLKPFTLDECMNAARKFRRTAPAGTYMSAEHVRELASAARHEAHEKGAAKRGLPTGPLAREETRAETRARMAREVADAKRKRQEAEAAADAEKVSRRNEPATV